jgi:hypothetical protein
MSDISSSGRRRAKTAAQPLSGIVGGLESLADKLETKAGDYGREADRRMDEAKQAWSAVARPQAAQGAWVFYATSSSDNSWVDDLAPGRIVFWWSGRADGKLVNNGGRVARGDTVVMVVQDWIIGTGVLAADSRETFVDKAGRRRWPVTCVQVFRPAISRPVIEAAAGGLVPRQGAFHPMSHAALEVIGKYSQLSGPEHDLPYARQYADIFLSEGESLDGALSRNGDIRRGEAKAAREGRPAPVVVSPDPPEPDEPALDLDARTQFIADAPSETEDQLDRGPIALFLARRMHLIWCEMNGCSPESAGRPPEAKAWERDNFIIHVDSPWGGGKTTFANFVARALSPGEERLDESHFLWSSLSPATRKRLEAAEDRAEVFAADFGDAFKTAHPDAWRAGRRPWIVARYNAWREQSSQPPWWQIFWTIHAEIGAAMGREARAAWAAARARNFWFDDPDAVERRLFDGLRIWWAVRRYKLGNPKLKAQLWGVVLSALMIGAAISLGWFQKALGLSSGEPLKYVPAFLGLIGAGGVGLLSLMTLFGQSMAPDMEFSAEHRHLGVADPVGRFRRMFDEVLRLTGRPVLLIVDDLDRCDPKAVVEVLRGLQTIVRSPRLFVMVLGDRAWIETAHQTYHKEMADLTFGSEARLGARFVEKVFQLSFRLPAIRPEVRDRYTRRAVERRDLRPVKPAPGNMADAAQPSAPAADMAAPAGQTRQSQQSPPSPPPQPDPKAEAFAVFEQMLDDILADGDKIGERERRVAEAKDVAARAGCESARLDEIASRRMVAAAGADASHQGEVTSILVALADSLPGNPRQIKRIMNTFAVYETVGRIHFNYQLSASGEGGEERARRWRQLAMWVTLATEWPETWRAIARRPDLIEVAYGPAKGAEAREAKFLKDLEAGQAELMSAALARMKAGRTLRALLSGGPAPAAGSGTPSVADFAGTRMEAEAVREFNRIIWEPGFDTRSPSSPSAA